MNKKLYEIVGNTITSTDQLPEGICVLADGGCEGNNLPATQVTQRHMYGSIAVFYNRKQIASTWHIDIGGGENPKQKQHRFDYEHQQGWASNNLAELMTMNNALSYIFALEHRANDLNLDHVTVLCDSEFTLGYATGVSEPGSKVHQSLHDENREISSLVNEIEKWGWRVNWKHVDEQWVKSVLGH